MNRERSTELLRKLMSVSSVGHRNSGHRFLVNPFLTLVHRECMTFTWEEAQNWETKGLFIGQDDTDEAATPYVIVVYEMRCGTLPFVILPKKKWGTWEPNLDPLKIDFGPGGEFGWWLKFDRWHLGPHIESYVEKVGAGQKVHHFARRPVS